MQTPSLTPGAKVLVIDDDADVRATFAELLRADGYRVTEASSAPDALASIDRSAPPDVILLDMVLPGMSGWALTQALRDDPALASIRLVRVSPGYVDD